MILILLALSFTLLNQFQYKREREIIGFIFMGLVVGFYMLTYLLICIYKVRLCIKSKSKKKKIKTKQETIHSETNTSQNLDSVKIMPRFSAML